MSIYSDANSLIPLNTGLKVSAIIGMLCYLILRSGLTKKDDSMIVLLISSIAGLVSNLLWEHYTDFLKFLANFFCTCFMPYFLWKLLFASIPLIFAIIARLTPLQEWIASLFGYTKYGDNWFFLKNIPNELKSVTIFLKSGEVLIASLQLKQNSILGKKAFHPDNQKSLLIKVLRSYPNKNRYFANKNFNRFKDNKNDVSYRYIFSDAIEAIDYRYNTNLPNP